MAVNYPTDSPQAMFIKQHLCSGRVNLAVWSFGPGFGTLEYHSVLTSDAHSLFGSILGQDSGTLSL